MELYGVTQDVVQYNFIILLGFYHSPCEPD